MLTLLNYTLTVCDLMSLSLHLLTFGFFAFQGQIPYLPEEFFYRYLEGFNILYKMQVIVEMSVCAFLFASLS